MFNNDLYFGLNQEEVKAVEEKYVLFEPLIQNYISPLQKRRYKEEVCQKLQISKRTLRRMIKKLKQDGITALLRKKRSDFGQYRKFSKIILQRALKLLQENPYRSITVLMKLLAVDQECKNLITGISASTLYYHLKKAGVNFQKKYIDPHPKIYHHFEAAYANQLWQGDARHGIYLPDPKKKDRFKRTYLFAWIDDFSRKVTFARYYWDEKLPRMEDCFRQAVLRWGKPEKLYCDNGKVVRFVSLKLCSDTRDEEVG